MTAQYVRPFFISFFHPSLTLLRVREEAAILVAADARRLLDTFNNAVQPPSDILAMTPLSIDRDLFALSQIHRRWGAIFDTVSSPVL